VFDVSADLDLGGDALGSWRNDASALGWVLTERGDLAGAAAAFERALRIDEATYGPGHPKVATSITNVGRVLHDRREPRRRRGGV
jgi:Tetratricopeptide repeat